MKKTVLAVCLCFGLLPVKAQLPVIHATTIIPQFPTPADYVKIVTRITTPNQSIKVDLISNVTHNPRQVNISTCYSQGLLPATLTHIDTFAVGQLQQGVYTINHKAFMSSTQQHCTKIDSNQVVSTITVGGLTISIKENETNAFSVYPNPASDRLYIKGYEHYSEAEIYQYDGRLVSIVRPDAQGGLNIASLTKGMYFLRFSNQPRSSTVKFMKE